MIYYHLIQKIKQKKKKRKISSVIVRRSKRLKGIKSEYELQQIKQLKTSKKSIKNELIKLESVKDYKQRKMDKYLELYNKNDYNDEDIPGLPPNATLNHTIKRVKSMAEKQLKTRIKRIENAQGNFAVIKMRHFAEVLFIEGHDELAKEAIDAFYRLLSLDKYKKHTKVLKTLYPMSSNNLLTTKFKK